MARAQVDHPLHTPTLHPPVIEDSIRAEIRAAQDMPGGVPPPETVEQARQTTSIWMFIGIAMVVAGLLLAVFSL